MELSERNITFELKTGTCLSDNLKRKIEYKEGW